MHIFRFCSVVTLVALAFLLAPPIQAKDKKWDVPCQKVFVTGSQVHEIAWALKGRGLENNLYRITCMQPVADARDASGILDLELDPKNAGSIASGIQDRENRVINDAFWVSCRSDSRGSYCFDSSGYALETSCNDRGCSTYYGPDLASSMLSALGLAADALTAYIHASQASGYLFSAQDHRLLWKYQSDVGDWHGDLAKYAECPKPFGRSDFVGWVCKKPTKLLD